MPDALDVGRDLQKRSLSYGWWSLCVFLALGLVLEALHGLKVDWYLAVSNQMRRLMWTLGHAHGTLLGLIHLAFAGSLAFCDARDPRLLRASSACLVAATFLLPGGFLLGGLWIYDGDPGLGVLLVPVGGLFLLVGVFLAAWSLRPRATRTERSDSPPLS